MVVFVDRVVARLYCKIGWVVEREIEKGKKEREGGRKGGREGDLIRNRNQRNRIRPNPRFRETSKSKR